MAKAPKARKFNIEKLPKEPQGWLRPIVWIIQTFFTEVSNALDKNLTFEDNFVSETRSLTNVTLNKVKSVGVGITTTVTEPKQIIVDIIKRDGTIISNAPVKWRNQGSGNIIITDLNVLKQTGTVTITQNSSTAIELNNAHRNSIGTNPHKVTRQQLGIDDYVVGWVDNTGSGGGIVFTDITGASITISPGGDLNVQSDWDETDDTSDAYILHKPDTITAQQTQDITNNKTRSESNETKVDIIRTQFVQNVVVGVDNKLRFALSDNGVVGSLNTYTPTKSDWNAGSTSDAYIANKPTTITSTQSTVINRFPTSAPPANNILVSDSSGNYVAKAQEVAGLPQITFHYVGYNDATGELVEYYAEDGETITIDPLLEYQPGFIQNEFQLNNDGTLRYIG